MFQQTERETVPDTPSPSVNFVVHAECLVCHRSFCVTAAGFLHVHGPKGNRCPGSHQHVGLQTSSAPSPTGPGAMPSTASAGRMPTLLPGNTQFQLCYLNTSIIKTIPRASRLQVASKFVSLLQEVTRVNSLSSWKRLLSFAPRCLHKPPQGGRRRSLALTINWQVDKEEYPSNLPKMQRHGSCNTSDAWQACGLVSSSLEEGDFRGAVRLASTTSSIVEANAETLATLLEKHPPSAGNGSYPLPPFVSRFSQRQQVRSRSCNQLFSTWFLSRPWRLETSTCERYVSDYSYSIWFIPSPDCFGLFF